MSLFVCTKKKKKKYAFFFQKKSFFNIFEAAKKKKTMSEYVHDGDEELAAPPRREKSCFEMMKDCVVAMAINEVKWRLFGATMGMVSGVPITVFPKDDL